MKTISVIGLGNFGYAFLKHFDKKSQNGYRVIGCDRNEKLIKKLRDSGEHLFLHKGEKISNNIEFTSNFEKAFGESDYVLLAVVSDFVEEVLGNNKAFLKKGVVIINTAKALDAKTGKRLSEIVKEVLKGFDYRYSLVAGGTIAQDLFKHNPLGASIASEDKEILPDLVRLLESENLRIYPTTDLVGVEYASAFKNVIAILAGIINGMGFSFGSETHIISSMAQEIEKIVVNKLGGRQETFSTGSQCWGNDLWLSSIGKTRNREFGILLGEGLSVKEAVGKMKKENKTVEGVKTLKIVDKVFNLEDVVLTKFLFELVTKNKISVEELDDVVSNWMAKL